MISGLPDRGLPPEPINPEGISSNRAAPPPRPPRRDLGEGSSPRPARVNLAAARAMGGPSAKSANGGPETHYKLTNPLPPSSVKPKDRPWESTAKQAIANASNQRLRQLGTSQVRTADLLKLATNLEKELDAIEVLCTKKAQVTYADGTKVDIPVIRGQNEKHDVLNLKEVTQARRQLREFLEASKPAMDHLQTQSEAMGGARKMVGKGKQLDRLVGTMQERMQLLKNLDGVPNRLEMGELLLRSHDNEKQIKSANPVQVRTLLMRAKTEPLDTTTRPGVTFSEVPHNAAQFVVRGKVVDAEARANHAPSTVSYSAPDGSQKNLEVGTSSIWGKPTKAGYTNEDRLTSATLQVNGQQIPFIGVYDGHNGSGVSSRLQQEFHLKLQEKLSQGELNDTNVYNALQSTCLEINNALRDEVPTIEDGSCGTMSIVVGDAVWTAQVGDSRAISVGSCASEHPTINTLSKDAEIKYDANGEPNEFALHALNAGVVFDATQRLPNIDNKGSMETPRSFGDCTSLGTTAQPAITKRLLSDLGEGPRYLAVGCDGAFEYCNSQDFAQELADGVKAGLNPAELSKALSTKAFNACAEYSQKIKSREPDDVTVVILKLP